jgi:NDP-sugar pyrophosphorylase family protein
MKPVDLLVLAGGFGTRLRAAVPDVPKPLAPVADRPFLSYQIDHWIQQGARSLTFLLHHQAALIRDFLDTQRTSARSRGCELQSLVEPRPLGTGGAVAFATRELRLADDFLVTNADTWLGDGIQRIAAADVPAIAVVEVDDPSRFGSVQLAQDKVIAFREKGAASGPSFINAGLYRLSAGLFAAWDGMPFSMEQNLLPALVERNSLNAVALRTAFIDIGLPADYTRFQRWVEAGAEGHP